MIQNEYEQIKKVIAGRRTVGRGKMNGTAIPDETINELLVLADWAPTHGRTEPWQFFVYNKDAMGAFGKAHGDIYWAQTPEDKRMETTRQKLEQGAGNASHLIVAAMKRGTNPKIPAIEEIAAASAAVQNILLGAAAAGIVTFWSTGGMTHNPAMKEYLGLGSDDIVLGLVYLGYTDEPATEGIRKIAISEKVKWL